MLKDWDFAQFFPNWSPLATGAGEDERLGEQSTSSSTTTTASSGGGAGGGGGGMTNASMVTPPRIHRRNESDSAINVINRSSAPAASPSGSDPLFGTRILWAGRNRLRDAPSTPGSDSEPVSLTEFSRKASQLELRGYGGISKTSDDLNSGGGVCPPPPRRQKTDLLELKKELEERRRTATRHNYHNYQPSTELPGGIKMRPNRPPLLKSSSEPCAPLTLFRDHQQVRESLPSSWGSASALQQHLQQQQLVIYSLFFSHLGIFILPISLCI